MSKNWLETIADKAKLSPEEAERRLRRRGVAADRAVRPARAFTIEQIAFSGEKKGKTSGVIDFQWTGLGPGVWAVTSEINLRGKSTVLEVVLWCLRGSTKNLQDDVRGWLEHISLQFSVDDERYRIAFNLVDGEPNGLLERRAPDDTFHALESFTSDEGFALVMARFMMDALDLDVLPALQGNESEKGVVEHGWLAQSNVFYLGGEHKYLFADTQMGGLPARLLQMYVGFPWASTKIFVTTAKKELEQKRQNSDRARRNSDADAETARTRLKAAIEVARKRIAELPNETTTGEQLAEAGEAVAAATRKLSELQARASKAQADASQVNETKLRDERKVRDLRETIVATQFFNGLNPQCCPRCEAKVAAARIKAETADFACSLCSETIPEASFEDVNEELEQAESCALASKAASERATADSKAATEASRAAATALAKVQSELDELVKGADFATKRNAELELAQLEGALKERNTPAPKIDVDPDEGLISIAVKETEKAYNAGRTDILKALNDEILPLGQQLGIEALESVSLNSNASMSLKKGGANTSFSKVTAGERLRLRLATAIALLRVGPRLGIGRHPGLLIIDSPGKEEVAKVNLEALLAELRKITDEMEGLQVIVAGTNVDEIVGVLGEDNCRIARGENYVW